VPSLGVYIDTSKKVNITALRVEAHGGASAEELLHAVDSQSKRRSLYESYPYRSKPGNL